MLNVNVKLNGMVSEVLTEGINLNDAYSLYTNPWESSSVVINNETYFVDYVLVKDNSIVINLI